MKTIWEDDGTNGPVLICCLPPPRLFKLNDGRRVLAKECKGDLHPVTYANITQATKAVARLGWNWRVTGNRPYYATYREE